ncbi:MAG: hypothetical protein GC159_19425 [Phycisphaera sp.]|nr:hypothetical protein [Phycisphaera sp.]
MAKEDKARIRVFFAELEGNNETLQQSLSSIAAAVNRTFQPDTRIIKVLPNAEDLDEDELIELANSELEEESVDEVVTQETPRKKSKKKKSKPPTYKHVDLDLRPKGKDALKDIYTQKKPKTDQERVTLFTHYLQHVLGLSDIDIDHMYTCFKDVGAKVPSNIGSVINNTSARKGWLDTSNMSKLRVTSQGENFVEHDLPRSE